MTGKPGSSGIPKEAVMTIRKRLFVSGIAILSLLYPAGRLRGQGRFEISVHYGQWTVDILRSAIEGAVSDAIKTNIRDKFLEEIQKDHPRDVMTAYSQDVTFDSGGDNWGFDVRWLPGGADGVFSLGLALEKVGMRLSLTEIAIKMGLENNVTHAKGELKGSANGDLKLAPLAFLANTRWEFSPGAKIRPFLVFGLGLTGGSTLKKAVFSYHYEGDYTLPSEETEHYEGSESKTGQELKDQAEEEGEDFSIPSVLPFIQLELGVSAALHPNVRLLASAGVLDGFVFRVGLAARI
jgi:hypothetical protein